MILLTAKFIGKDSLGFEHGHIYTMSLDINYHGDISIKAKGGSFPDYKDLRCEYSSVEKFNENWEIQHLNIVSTSSTTTRTTFKEVYSPHIIGELTSNMRDTKIKKLIF